MHTAGEYADEYKMLISPKVGFWEITTKSTFEKCLAKVALIFFKVFYTVFSKYSCKVYLSGKFARRWLPIIMSVYRPYAI